MKYNDTNKDKDNVELDDMDIKSHLDASLDLSGISVSEDLINRTLAAIKKQETEQQKTEQQEGLGGLVPASGKEKKVINWGRYVRGFASVAAAAVILVAGYHILNNTGMKKDSNMESTSTADNGTFDTAENSIYSSLGVEEDLKMQDAAVEEPKEDMATTSEATTEMAPQFSIAAGVVEDKEKTDAYGSVPSEVAPSITSSSASTDEVIVGVTEPSSAGNTSFKVNEQEGTKKAGIVDTKLTFRNIFLSEPEKAEYITLMDHINGVTITITEQSDIMDFYSLMDKHQFTYGSEGSGDQNYTVEIGSPEVDTTYVMTIGKLITVSYTDQVSASQSIYDVVDKELLTQDLSNFMAKYKK